MRHRHSSFVVYEILLIKCSTLEFGQGNPITFFGLTGVRRTHLRDSSKDSALFTIYFTFNKIKVQHAYLKININYQSYKISPKLMHSWNASAFLSR